MPVTDSEIQLLSNEDADLSDLHVNIMRRLAVECHYDASAMIDRSSEIFANAMRTDPDFQGIVDSLITSMRYGNEQMRKEFEDKLVNIGLHQLKMAFEKVIALAPSHTDAEICQIFECMLESEDFEHNSLQAAKQSDAYADLITTIANYQLEQYSSPALIFTDSEELSSLPNVGMAPSMRP